MFQALPAPTCVGGCYQPHPKGKAETTDGRRVHGPRSNLRMALKYVALPKCIMDAKVALPLACPGVRYAGIETVSLEGTSRTCGSNAGAITFGTMLGYLRNGA